MQALLIRHFSLVNSLGAGAAANLAALRARRSGLAPCEFHDVALQTYVGRVPGLEEARVRSDLSDYDCRNNRLAQWGLEQDGFAAAVAAARQKYGARRIGVFMGTSTSGLLHTELAYRRRNAEGALPADFHYQQTHNTYSLADFVQRYLGLSGPALVVSSACSSTAKVFGNAARMMAAGLCDAAVVGGVDSLCFTTLHGFNALGLISQAPCRPFDAQRDGISLGEGAGFALVEKNWDEPDALRILGIGESCDAYHMSTPHPQGLGAQLAMRRALDAAGLSPAEIDYINLHGTSTKTNDASEDQAVYKVFGERTPCSSTKGWTGHLLGAAGITEALLSLLAMQHDVRPGSLNTGARDEALRCNYQIENCVTPLRRVLSNSFGFGGSNCSLVLGRG